MSKRDEEQEAAAEVRVTDRRRHRPDGTPVVLDDADVVELAAEEVAADAVESDLDVAAREAAEYRDHLLRLQAEFDNYRKRVQKEQAQLVEFGAVPVVRTLLEVIDDFELALMAAQSQPDFDVFLRGVELVYAKLLDSLSAAGVERMEPLGTPFDPELHEALMQEGEGDAEPVVADVLRPGYTMRGRVVRPAGVKVRRS